MNEDVYQQRYRNLNDEQRQAVDAIDGPVMVIAGPGSGKTELLSVRVANILRTRDVQPSNILCLTFTEAAQSNMRNRLIPLLGADAYRVAIHTFHSFSSDIINRFPEFFYHGAVFRLADDLLRIELLEEILQGLDYSDPLAGRHQDAYTYLPSIRGAIADLKKAGLTPEAFDEILHSNEKFLQVTADDVARVFGDRMSTATIEAAAQLVDDWAGMVPDTADVLQFGQTPPLVAVLYETLALAVAEADAIGKTSPLTTWKGRFVTKDAKGRAVLKDLLNLPKMHSLAAMYASYRRIMHERRYFDYDDLLLDVIETLEREPQLRYGVQEQYQYVLVDEFQDTNDAQMKLLSLVSDAPVYEGRPNIMVVGDDDQAIYKFQGANVANIQQFRRTMQEPVQVVLTKNYRSTQEILDVARSVIVQGANRMEDAYDDIVKELEAAGQPLPGAVEYRQYATRAHEFAAVAGHIRELIDAGEPAEDIAVITRWHRDLEEFAAYLMRQGIPVRYEKQRDVLRQPHIQQLLQMARFVWLLSRHQQAEADELLPEILSYPFWQIDRNTLWQLSVAAHQAPAGERLWLQQMDASGNARLQAMAAWWRELRGLAETESLEKMLEYLMGAHTPVLDGDSHADGSDDPTSPLAGFTSPFRDYYFDDLKLQQERDQYISFLSGLQVFIKALRDYRPDRELKLTDLLQFVDMRIHNYLPIVDLTPYVSGQHAVQLLSVHKAKGLEFGHVFLILLQDSIWQGGGRPTLLPFPANLPISSESDTGDDNLRIFYVALTRAKHHLLMSGHLQQDDGKESPRLAFTAAMDAIGVAAEEVELPDPTEVLEAAWQTRHGGDIDADAKALLIPQVENNVISATHLNDFLDLRYGGPRTFLENHVLRFPQPQTLSQAYGTAVHSAVRRLFRQFRLDGVLPDVSFLIESYQQELAGQRLSRTDHEKLLKRGQDELQLYYVAESDRFSPQDIVELDFRQQQVVIGDAQLTGKIDRLALRPDGSVWVHDLKTGKPYTAWKGKSADETYGLLGYRRQLQFYKLLIEHSRDYAGKWNVAGGQLDFLRPLAGDFVSLPLEHFDDVEMERLVRLINIVYEHVKNLNFPDTSAYSPDAKGSAQFEEDLLEGNI
jgi:DNA helicase-2/ATP-dependent DNA helicase PcrA